MFGSLYIESLVVEFQSGDFSVSCFSDAAVQDKRSSLLSLVLVSPPPQLEELTIEDCVKTPFQHICFNFSFFFLSSLIILKQSGLIWNRNQLNNCTENLCVVCSLSFGFAVTLHPQKADSNKKNGIYVSRLL